MDSRLVHLPCVDKSTGNIYLCQNNYNNDETTFVDCKMYENPYHISEEYDQDSKIRISLYETKNQGTAIIIYFESL